MTPRSTAAFLNEKYAKLVAKGRTLERMAAIDADCPMGRAETATIRNLFHFVSLVANVQGWRWLWEWFSDRFQLNSN